MSSVLRFMKQTPSNTFFTESTTSMWLYSTIQTYADGSGATFTSPTVITFPTVTDLTSCLIALDNNIDIENDDVCALQDMGKRVYMGVEGEENEMVVFALVKIIQGNGVDQGFVGYVCVLDVTDTLDVETARGAW